MEGAERTDDAYVRMFRPFSEGDVAQRTALDTYRERLAETGLFGSIEVEPQLPAEDGTTDLLVRVDERDHRTLGGGVNFATELGIDEDKARDMGLDIYKVGMVWPLERRGILHVVLEAPGDVSEPVQILSAGFRKQRPQLPGFYDLSFSARNDNTDALQAQTLEVGGRIGKLWANRNLTTSGGINLQYSDITERECFLESRFDDVLGIRHAGAALTLEERTQLRHVRVGDLPGC